MDLSPKANRVLCAEPLEGRWLLSGIAPADTAQLSPTPTVTLNEPEQLSDEEEEEEGEVEIDPSELPANVLAAFNAAFAGATIEEVEREKDDERGIEYGITARTDEGEVDITISPAGDIVETERSIDISELPQDVVDELRERVQDAQIFGAADLGGGNYEVLYTSGGQQYEVEAQRVAAAEPPPAPPGDEDPSTPPLVSSSTPDAIDERKAAIEADTASTDGTVSQQQAVAQAARTTTAAGAEVDDNAIEDARAAAATTTPSQLDPRVTQALEALAAGAGATVWLPQVADAMVDVLPVDVAAVERGLQEMLDKLNSLTSNAAEESALTVGASRLAMAVVLVAAVKLLTHGARKPAGGPVVLFGGVNSSWSWVLGTTTPKRRRITLSRQRDP